MNSKKFIDKWLENYEEEYEVDEKYCCEKCKTDKYVSFDLCHTADDIPYDIAYCEKCSTRVWEEEIE